MKNMRYPEPRIWKALDEWEPEAHRFVHCSTYDDCLMLAAKLNWPGFTCFFCPKNLIKKEEEERKAWLKQQDLLGSSADQSLKLTSGTRTGARTTKSSTTDSLRNVAARAVRAKESASQEFSTEQKKENNDAEPDGEN